jgi:predicted Zn finger-like uncharacterized protein
VSTIIECPACSTRYKMNKPIPEGGRSVKCARCGHQWRIAPEVPEELAEVLDTEAETGGPGAGQEHYAQTAGTEPPPENTAFPPQTIGDAWNVRREHIAAAMAAGTEAHPETAAPPPQTIGDAWNWDPTAASRPQADAEAHAENADPSPETIGDAWEVRRGHLAAAIASSISGTPDAPSGGWIDPGAEEEHPPTRPAWASHESAFQSETAFQGFGDGTGEEDDAASDPRAAADQADAGFDAGATPAWADTSWMSEDPTEADPAEIDPEISVRRALKAAMEDEGSDDGAFEGNGGIAPGSRPAFPHPTSFEETMASLAGEPDGGEAGEHPAESGEPRLRFASMATHSESVADAIAARARRGDPEDAGEDSEDAEKFENDIVGIFRQQMQEKRSFGPPPGRQTAEDGFTDYDREPGAATEQADDRYMADSPLDADAAALQAALEGSLRERHAEEGGGGGLALAAAWAVFLSVLSGVTLAFINFRDEMVVALPGTAALYRGVGFAVQDRQVDFGPVSYRWTVAEGKPMIEVTGQIINLTDREIAVPRVLVNVHDKDNTDTVKATATVRSEPLAAHETADFTLEFLSPPKSISQIELAFAETD